MILIANFWKLSHRNFFLQSIAQVVAHFPTPYLVGLQNILAHFLSFYVSVFKNILGHFLSFYVYVCYKVVPHFWILSTWIRLIMSLKILLLTFT